MNPRRLCISVALLSMVACGAPDAPTCSADECACSPSGCACPNGSACGWAVVVCGDDAANCHLQCAAHACVAHCGSVCEAGCTDGASCDVVAADRAVLYCSRSTCDLHGGAGTIATCADAATCSLTCAASPCGVDCSAGSTCMLQCPGDATFHAVTTAESCPAP